MKPLSDHSQALIETGRTYYAQNYKPRDMIIERGLGSRVWDMDGNEYVDFSAGIAVTSLGHANPELIEALTEQASKIWHTSNIFFTEPPVRLAEELCVASKFAKRVFFSNSGGEANEAAIKAARKWAADKGYAPEQREIITFTGSFHGRTLATTTATAQPEKQKGFEPLPAGFRYVAFNDFDAIEKAMSNNVCAIMSECVQGEGGVMPAKPGFLKHLRELCDKHDALLMLDQVQCGMGRTGHLFSHWCEENVVPDIVTLAKGLGGGAPIGATLFGDKVEETLQFGTHGSTFGGSPLSSSVARVVLQKLQSKELMKNVEVRGKQIRDALSALNKELGLFKEVRGRGLMIGAELVEKYAGKAGEITEHARSHGVLVLVAGPNVLRFVPALTIIEDDVREGIARLKDALTTTIG